MDPFDPLDPLRPFVCARRPDFLGCCTDRLRSPQSGNGARGAAPAGIGAGGDGPLA